MTRDEAEKLARIFENVDGGCSVCVSRVCADANEAGFGFYWKPDDDDGRAVAVVLEKPDLEEW